MIKYTPEKVSKLEFINPSDEIKNKLSRMMKICSVDSKEYDVKIRSKARLDVVSSNYMRVRFDSEDVVSHHEFLSLFETLSSNNGVFEFYVK